MKSKEWLILNACECWLHYYGDPNNSTVEQYKELRDEYKQLIDAPKPKTTRKPRLKTTDDSSSTTETV